MLGHGLLLSRGRLGRLNGLVLRLGDCFGALGLLRLDG